MSLAIWLLVKFLAAGLDFLVKNFCGFQGSLLETLVILMFRAPEILFSKILFSFERALLLA